MKQLSSIIILIVPFFIIYVCFIYLPKKTGQTTKATPSTFIHYFIIGGDTIISKPTDYDMSKYKPGEQWSKLDSTGWYHYLNTDSCKRQHTIIKAPYTKGDIIYGLGVDKNGNIVEPVGIKRPSGRVRLPKYDKPVWTEDTIYMPVITDSMEPIKIELHGQ